MALRKKPIRGAGHLRERITIIRPGNPRYPPALAVHRGVETLPAFAAIGSLEILEGNLIGLVCSGRCPGPVILEMYGLATSISADRCVVVGGFHSPMERQCLEIFLARHVPVIVCPARPLEGMRIPVPWQQPLREDRLLIASPYLKGNRRTTKATASHRNRFVAAIAKVLLIPYAQPGGVAEAIGRLAACWGKGLFTLRLEEQPWMQAVGARPIAELGEFDRCSGFKRETLVLTPE
jgi:predicted Rossmann fold nucleotide-binding protein DprA/Smf involved in DNA uptake